MSLVDDPASFLREKFAESFKVECQTKVESEEKILEKKLVKTDLEPEQNDKEKLDFSTYKQSKVANDLVSKDKDEINTIDSTIAVSETKPGEEEKEKDKSENSIEEKITCNDPATNEKETKSPINEKILELTTSEKCCSVKTDEETVDHGEAEGEEKKNDESNDDGKDDCGGDNEGAGARKGNNDGNNYDEANVNGNEDAAIGGEHDDDDEIKTVDDSVYDFDDELDTKKDKQLHDKVVKKENNEETQKSEDVEEKEKKVVTNTDSEKMKEISEESHEKIKDFKTLIVESVQSENEKIKSDADVKKEVASSCKENELITQIPKIQKAFNMRKSFKEENLKQGLPELEIIQPWARLHELDQFLWRDRCSPAPSEPSLAQLIAHSYQNPIKWPRDHAILVRLQHIIHAVEYKEWPVSSNFSAYSAPNIPSSTLDIDISARNTPEANAKRDSSTPMSMPEGSEVITITTDHTPKHHIKKKKHHIAIDVETERAKLHALLNCAALGQSQHQNIKALPMWEAADESLSEDSRRSTPVSLQPPPAHQQTSRTFSGISSNLTMPFDLSKFHASTKNTSNSSGNTGSLTPMDLSSNLSKNDHFKTKESEVQDLSIAQDLSSKSKQPITTQKSKLENTLDKLLKRKNCPPEEPIVDKEKKRRKLDAIVLGLSAAKEQQCTSLFGDLKKTSCISPSVTVTPASAHPPPSTTPASKPFTITVTSVPASSSNSDIDKKKDNFSSFLNQAEQQHGKLLLKQQQHLLQQQQNLLQQQGLSSLTSQSRKSYEAMVADLSKVADFSKLGSYSHESKVIAFLKT